MSPSDRYSGTAIGLHWLIALAVVGQFAWGWWMQDIPKQPPGPRVDAFNLHKSVGLTILALMCVRLLWRWRHPAPPLPPMPRWQAGLARTTHVVLYVALFVMPLGSNRVCENLSQRTFRGTPYCIVIEMAVANESISPETTEPVLAIVMKISPG